MRILPLQFFKNGYMKEALVFGGSVPKDKLDGDKVYPSSLQNYLIDTGSEVILVDTGFPDEMPLPEKKEGQMIYPGEKVASFSEALHNIGYKIEDIDKIILTHKHPDHSGELKSFTKTKIFISEIEADSMKLCGENIERVSFTHGAYHNFEKSQEITKGVYMLPAYGHTKGNSIVVVEDGDLFYMIHGDVTYCDSALQKGYLSIVYEDLKMAKETLEKVKEFVMNNKTVYLSTHTPEGVYNLKDKKIMKLNK